MYYPMKTYILTFLITLISFDAYCQTVILGKVTDKDGSLPGTNVYLDGTYDGSTTDANGEFSFRTAKKGKVLIKASFMICRDCPSNWKFVLKKYSTN